jgi:tetratricopeptide (TPR) repeat protein
MAAQQCEQDSMPISLMGTNEDVSKKNLDQIEPTFMYTQILKEILLTIKFEQIHFREFIAYCLNDLAENEKQLKILTQFEQGYREKTPIWWYTRESFLYEMLNRALREMHVDMIIKLGFFINDIQRQIKQLHQEQFGVPSSSDSFKLLYRGQGMMKIKFEEMSKNKGGLISFNSFLSTSEESKVSLQFAKNALKQPEMIGIFFVMKIDPTQSTTPFASITEVSFFKGKEKEVLFSMHTVFRIGEITSMDEKNRLFQVELTLTSDNDKDLCKLTDYIQKNTYWSEEGWYRLGSVLLKMGQFEQAQQVYEILLGQTTSESEKGRFYHQLGLAKNDRGEYKEALVLYENALAIYNRTLSPKDLNLAKCYNNIGLVHYNMDDYAKALLSHEKSLEVKQQSLPADHADLGVSYNNIGNVYFKMGDYSKALLYHEKALEIKKQSLLPNHPSLGSSYNNIGLVHENMDDYSKARSYYERAVDIGKQSLPPDHPHLKQWRDNLDKIKQKL